MLRHQRSKPASYFGKKNVDIANQLDAILLGKDTLTVRDIALILDLTQQKLDVYDEMLDTHIIYPGALNARQ